jgi:hypothetical protein
MARLRDYRTINVHSDTYQEVKKYAGRLQAEHGGRVTEDIAVKTALKRAAIKDTK